jgi:hypothetical protein
MYLKKYFCKSINVLKVYLYFDKKTSYILETVSLS